MKIKITSIPGNELWSSNQWLVWQLFCIENLLPTYIRNIWDFCCISLCSAYSSQEVQSDLRRRSKNQVTTASIVWILSPFPANTEPLPCQSLHHASAEGRKQWIKPEFEDYFLCYEQQTIGFRWRNWSLVSYSVLCFLVYWMALYQLHRLYRVEYQEYCEWWSKK